jgi:hypothetical protein
MSNFRTDVQILKVNTELGLIFGFAMICKVRDEHDNLVPYNDTDDEQFDEQGMLEAITDFAMTKRVACEMHARDEDGQPVQDGGVIHHFPLTEEIAKALGIITPVTGLLVALKPDNPETLEKARTGEYTGFSIGGVIIEAEDA